MPLYLPSYAVEISKNDKYLFEKSTKRKHRDHDEENSPKKNISKRSKLWAN